MNLFFKIFLWFLATCGLMVGVVLFLNYTIQTEPVVSRWRINIHERMKIYAETGAQIYDTEGIEGLKKFTKRLKIANTITEVDIISTTGEILLSDVEDPGVYKTLIEKALADGKVHIEPSEPRSSIAGRIFRTENGTTYVMIIRWTWPEPVPVLGETRLKYLRGIGLFLTAVIVCYALARYISSPITKIRKATQKLADGDLSTRVAGEIGNRRDELEELARDFDVMADRIENLITSQQRLSRDISHELRSPLARLNVALEIAKQKVGPEAGGLLARIENESQRLNEMISRLLTLSSLESGSRDFDKAEVNLSKLVANIAADADFEAQGNNKHVKLIQNDEFKMVGNEILLQSAVENVLRNAVKYTDEGTVVEVSLKAEADIAVIAIRDFGGGVPENELKNLFKPFYRIGEARDRGTGGSGLGLAIAEQAVNAHNGTITAHNVDNGLEVVMTVKSLSAIITPVVRQ